MRNNTISTLLFFLFCIPSISIVWTAEDPWQEDAELNGKIDTATKDLIKGSFEITDITTYTDYRPVIVGTAIKQSRFIGCKEVIIILQGQNTLGPLRYQLYDRTSRMKNIHIAIFESNLLIETDDVQGNHIFYEETNSWVPWIYRSQFLKEKKITNVPTQSVSVVGSPTGTEHWLCEKDNEKKEYKFYTEYGKHKPLTRDGNTYSPSVVGVEVVTNTDDKTTTYWTVCNDTITKLVPNPTGNNNWIWTLEQSYIYDTSNTFNYSFIQILPYYSNTAFALCVLKEKPHEKQLLQINLNTATHTYSCTPLKTPQDLVKISLNTNYTPTLYALIKQNGSKAIIKKAFTTNLKPKLVHLSIGNTSNTSTPYVSSSGSLIMSTSNSSLTTPILPIIPPVLPPDHAKVIKTTKAEIAADYTLSVHPSLSQFIKNIGLDDVNEFAEEEARSIIVHDNLASNKIRLLYFQNVKKGAKIQDEFNEFNEFREKVEQDEAKIIPIATKNYLEGVEYVQKENGHIAVYTEDAHNIVRKYVCKKRMTNNSAYITERSRNNEKILDELVVIQDTKKNKWYFNRENNRINILSDNSSSGNTYYLIEHIIANTIKKIIVKSVSHGFALTNDGTVYILRLNDTSEKIVPCILNNPTRYYALNILNINNQEDAELGIIAPNTFLVVRKKNEKDTAQPNNIKKTIIETTTESSLQPTALNKGELQQNTQNSNQEREAEINNDNDELSKPKTFFSRYFTHSKGGKLIRWAWHCIISLWARHFPTM